jgi:hypothetical protein
MRNLCCVAILLFSNYCIADDASPNVTDEVTVAGVRMQILTDNDSCTLGYYRENSFKTINLEPKPPCFFLRRDDSSPQCFAYPEQGVLAALIIAGTAITSDARATWNLPRGLVCGSERQGILISESGVAASKRILRSGIGCKAKGSDEKDFWFFAHE